MILPYSEENPNQPNQAGCHRGKRWSHQIESSKVGSVLINTEVALVVPHERAKEKYTSSCVDH